MLLESLSNIKKNSHKEHKISLFEMDGFFICNKTLLSCHNLIDNVKIQCSKMKYNKIVNGLPPVPDLVGISDVFNCSSDLDPWSYWEQSSRI